MNRTLRWQLSAVAAAAGFAVCVAHAQITDPTMAAQATTEATEATEAAQTTETTETTVTDPAATTEAPNMEGNLQDPISTDTTAPVTSGATTSSTTPATTSATPTAKRSSVYSAGAPTTAEEPQPSTIVVVPTIVDQSAVQAKAWAALEAEPITREEVAAEAAYANKHGLIPRGEASIVGEDKGTAYVEQADQARHARATQQYLAKLDIKHQQFFAIEQERLNRLALAEQQRQQAAQQQLVQQQSAQPTQ